MKRSDAVRFLESARVEELAGRPDATLVVYGVFVHRDQCMQNLTGLPESRISVLDVCRDQNLGALEGIDDGFVPAGVVSYSVETGDLEIRIVSGFGGSSDMLQEIAMDALETDPRLQEHIDCWAAYFSPASGKTSWTPKPLRMTVFDVPGF